MDSLLVAEHKRNGENEKEKNKDKEKKIPACIKLAILHAT